MNKWLEILVGLIFIIAAVVAWISGFWGMGQAALIVLKGGILWFLIIAGLLFLLLGISDLKE
jgi:hypothetical protein